MNINCQWWATALLTGAIVTFGAVGSPAADGQSARLSVNNPPSGRPVWFREMEGRHYGPEGGPITHQWFVDSDGRGRISVNGPDSGSDFDQPATAFALTVPEHVRFARMMEALVTSQYDQRTCSTDQAEEVLDWKGGIRPDGRYTLSYGCHDPANIAQHALLNRALSILRTAAARDLG